MTESEIVKFLHSLPAAGSRVKVTYNCEYNGMEPAAKDEVRQTKRGKVTATANRASKAWTRVAVVKQKITKGARSSITVELQSEHGTVGKYGKYMTNFHVIDIMSGTIKIEGVR